MSTPVRYVAEPSHVHEVSLRGSADLAYWTDRLREERLVPVSRGDRARLLVVAAEMSFLGIRFAEVSFSVRVTPPEPTGGEGFFLVHAFNTNRGFAFAERVLFSTPYSHADCGVSASAFPSIRVVQAGRTTFSAAMRAASPATPRNPSWRGSDGWEGPVFLPRARGRTDRAERYFFARMRGDTCLYPFVAATDRISIEPAGTTGVLPALVESRFVAEEWVVRPDAAHGKSKTYRRNDRRGPLARAGVEDPDAP